VSDAETEADAGGEERRMPDATLQTHLFHLASQVSMALGEIENPVTKKREVDLPTARFLIDTIAMIGEKTAGNRTPDEDEYVAGVLTNLRMAYVNKAK
jgi:hypothetical protein